MPDAEPELTPELIALSVVVKELLAVLPKTKARAFLRGMTFTMSGRDGWEQVVPIRARDAQSGVDPAAVAAAWWREMEPAFRHLLEP